MHLLAGWVVAEGDRCQFINVHNACCQSALLFSYHLSVSFALSSFIVILIIPTALAVPAMSRFGRIRAERGHGQVTPQAAVAACSPSSRSNDNEHKQGWIQSNQQSTSKNKIKSHVTSENLWKQITKSCKRMCVPVSTEKHVGHPWRGWWCWHSD